MRVHTKLHLLKDEQKLQAWIFRIARNSINDYYRKTKPHQPLGDFEIADDYDDTDLMREWSGCLEPFLKDLPEKYRTALELAEIKGMKQKEVAEKLGISYSGAKSRVQRGRELLKQGFIDCCKFALSDDGYLVGEPNREECPRCSADAPC